jgi:hypothetical protein
VATSGETERKSRIKVVEGGHKDDEFPERSHQKPVISEAMS